MLDYQAIIFDMDGVIIDSEPLHEQAQRVVFSQYQLTVPASAMGAFKGKSEEDVFGHIVQEYAGNRLDAAELIAMKHEVYSHLIGDLRLIAGAKSFIERLTRGGIRLALTTSSTRRDQERSFALFDLQPYFEVVITRDDVALPKPDPEPYRTTARRLDLAPARCLVIEDSINGVLSARRAGCAVVGLATSFSAERLLEAGAGFVADDYAALAHHLYQESP